MASTNALYGLTPNSQGTGEIINMYNDSNPEHIEQVKSILISWLIEVTREPEFQRRFINRGVLSANNSLNDVMMYVIWCTNELLGAVIDSLGGKVNSNFLQAIGSTCFIISLKLIGGYDWLSERGLYAYMAHLCSGMATQSQLIRLESDILSRTGWKGCPVAGVSEENIALGGRRRTCRRKQKKRHTRRGRIQKK